MKHDFYLSGLPPARSYAALVMLNNAYSAIEKQQWAKFRRRFLKKVIFEKGYLECEYCHRRDLSLDGLDTPIATLDHVIPRSQGGEETDEANVVISCPTCNHKKASQTKERFLTSKYLAVKIKSQQKSINANLQETDQETFDRS